jgi:hypothetical protein
MDKLDIKKKLNNEFKSLKIEDIKNINCDVEIIKYAYIYVSLVNYYHNIKPILQKELTILKKNDDLSFKKIIILNDFFKKKKEMFFFVNDFVIFVGIIWYSLHFPFDAHPAKIIEMTISYHCDIYKHGKLYDYINIKYNSVLYKKYYKQQLIDKIHARASKLFEIYSKYIIMKYNNQVIKIYKWWNKRNRKCFCCYNNKDCIKKKKLIPFLQVPVNNTDNEYDKFHSAELYNALRAKPNFNDRDIALYHYNLLSNNNNSFKFMNTKIQKNFIIDHVKFRQYQLKKTCNTLTSNWLTDVVMWFFIIFITNTPNNFTSYDKLMNGCFKYLHFSRIMRPKNHFVFYIPLHDYSEYFMENNNLNIETDYSKHFLTHLYKIRFHKIYNTAHTKYLTNFKSFYEKAEEKLRKEREEKLHKEREEKLHKEREEKLHKEREDKLRKEKEDKLRKEKEDKLREENEKLSKIADKYMDNFLNELDKEELKKKKKNCRKKKKKYNKKRISASIKIQAIWRSYYIKNIFLKKYLNILKKNRQNELYDDIKEIMDKLNNVKEEINDIKNNTHDLDILFHKLTSKNNFYENDCDSISSNSTID